MICVVRLMAKMNFHFKKETIKRIVVRGPNWLGDAVMCTPALLMLRDIFPSASITLLVRPSIAALLESHPSIDHMVVYDHKGNHSGWRGMLDLVRMLRKERFDLAVLFQNAFDPDDAYTSLKKQYRLLRTILTFADSAEEIVEQLRVEDGQRLLTGTAEGRALGLKALLSVGKVPRNEGQARALYALRIAHQLGSLDQGRQGQHAPETH